MIGLLENPQKAHASESLDTVTERIKQLTLHSERKKFNKLPSHLIGLILQFACSNVKDYAFASRICKKVNASRGLAFQGNSSLYDSFFTKRQSLMSPRTKANPETTLGFIRRHAHSIRSLTYPNKGVSIKKSNIEAFVRMFRNIEILKFKDCVFEGEDALQPLSTLSLRELQFFNTSSVYTQFTHIGKISTLQKLTIFYAPLAHHSQKCYQQLQTLSQLQELDFTVCHIRDEDLIFLPKENLRSLSLDGCKNITNQGLKHLRSAIHIERLNLRNTLVTGEGLGEISNLHITHMNLRGLRGIKLSVFQHLDCLKELDLARTDISDKDLKPLKRAINLTKLVLDSCPKIKGFGLRYLKSPKHQLRVLDLEACLMEQFVPIPTLTHLFLGYVYTLNINDEFLALVCQKMVNLEVLELCCGDVTDKGLETLASLKKLSTFRMDESQVPKFTKAGQEHLRKQLPQLSFR